VSPVTNRPVAEIPTNALSRVSADLGTAQSAAAVTANLLERNQSLLGEPSTNQRPRVDRLLSTNPAVRSAAVKAEESRADAEGANVAAVQVAERKWVEQGQEAEKAKARSAWRRLWAWSIGTLVLGGTIALCVFFPAIIPILGQLLGWIVGMVPQLANWLGVVSVKAYQRSVSAFQEAKRRAALKGD
jgi:hypothetical protein